MHKKDQILIPKAEMEKGVRYSNLDWALKMLIIPCFFFHHGAFTTCQVLVKHFNKHYLI